MFSHFCSKIRKSVFSALAFGGAVLLIGCGDSNHSLLAPEHVNVVSPAVQRADVSKRTGPISIGFSPNRLSGLAAGKKAGATKSKSGSKWIEGKKGGSIFLLDFDDLDLGGLNVVSAVFKVKKKAMEGDHQISMTVHSGSSLEDVWVDFGPGGLSFNPSAELKLLLVGDTSGIDKDALAAYHHASDGSVEQVEMEVKIKKHTLHLTIEVPGFSGYSPGEDPPEGDGP